MMLSMSGFPRTGAALHWVRKPGCRGTKGGGGASLGNHRFPEAEISWEAEGTKKQN